MSTMLDPLSFLQAESLVPAEAWLPILLANLVQLLLVLLGIMFLWLGVAEQIGRSKLHTLPVFVRVIFAVAGVLLILAGVAWLVVKGSPGSTTVEECPPSAHLVSVSYKVDDWNPHMINLQTASEDGIAAATGHSLQFFDLRADLSETRSGLVVQAEIYDSGGKLVGHSDPVEFTRGIKNLGKIAIDQFAHGSVPDAWNVQASWESMEIALITYSGTGVVGRQRTLVRLNPDGNSWLLSPPYMSFASVVYSLNDGPAVLLDLRSAGDNGLPAKAGDRLTLLELWYRSDSASSETVQVEAYLTAGGYNPDTWRRTDSATIRAGIYKLDFLNSEPISWVIPEGTKHLVLSVVRSGKVVMDRLIIPLGTDGL